MQTPPFILSAAALSPVQPSNTAGARGTHVTSAGVSRRRQKCVTAVQRALKLDVNNYCHDRAFCHGQMNGWIMRKIVLTLTTAATVAVSAMAAPAPAEARGGRVAAGLIGGLAAGAILGGAIASSRPAYAYPPGYYAPAYAGRPCYWTRERFWDGYGWRARRIQVCG